MIGEKVIEKRIVTLSEVDALLKVRTKDVEPKYEQEVTIKYVSKFKTLTPKQSESMKKDLLKLDYLDDFHAVKVVDLMPGDDKDLSVLFGDKRIPLTKAQNDEVLELVKKYAK
ncbi:MAG: hypothetical protein GOV15_03365 [Candidatus Diapherotrites archaeon]|nr:hypothetical protein [Candidatus Diapherotrites archaeon]